MPSDEEIKDEVEAILRNHTGADNPISSREIDDELGLDSVGSFPNTRAVIRELLLEDQIPIASSSNGYYIIETEDELAEYIESLESRMLSIADRKYGIRRAAIGWDGDIESSEDADLL